MVMKLSCSTFLRRNETRTFEMEICEGRIGENSFKTQALFESAQEKPRVVSSSADDINCEKGRKINSPNEIPHNCQFSSEHCK